MLTCYLSIDILKAQNTLNTPKFISLPLLYYKLPKQCLQPPSSPYNNRQHVNLVKTSQILHQLPTFFLLPFFPQIQIQDIYILCYLFKSIKLKNKNKNEKGKEKSFFPYPFSPYQLPLKQQCACKSITATQSKLDPRTRQIIRDPNPCFWIFHIIVNLLIVPVKAKQKVPLLSTGIE